MSTEFEYEAVIDYWLGEASKSFEALRRRNRMWFTPDPEVDRAVESRFGKLLSDHADELTVSWRGKPRGRLALIILFDQFPRNIYRGTAKAFAFDSQALNLCLTGIDTGMDKGFEPVERMFFYMPLQHAETAEAQDRCVALFESLTEACAAEQREFFVNALEHAREHRQLILRFGRFPHRNRTLGRASTVEEIAYLDSGGASYGQPSR